jgi:hypothetical protein
VLQIPSSIVSDRDPVFTGHFWKELFGLAGVTLQFMSVFHPRLMSSQKPQTKLLLCISVVSPETGHDSGFNGCHGRSFATTLHSKHRSGPRHSELYMAGILRRFAHTRSGKQCCQQWTPSSGSVMSSCRRSWTDWSRRSSITRIAMTASTVSLSFKWGNRSACGFYTCRWRP